MGLVYYVPAARHAKESAPEHVTVASGRASEVDHPMRSHGHRRRRDRGAETIPGTSVKGPDESVTDPPNGPKNTDIPNGQEWPRNPSILNLEAPFGSLEFERILKRPSG